MTVRSQVYMTPTMKKNTRTLPMETEPNTAAASSTPNLPPTRATHFQPASALIKISMVQEQYSLNVLQVIMLSRNSHIVSISKLIKAVPLVGAVENSTNQINLAA